MSDRGTPSLPAQPQQIPGFPSNFRPLPFEGYETLNTKTPRPGIEDKECSWLDGMMPLAPNNVRILPDIGPDAYKAPGSLTIVWHGYANISDQEYGVALLSDGSVRGFFLPSGGTVSILPADTIEAPSTTFGFSQWGSQYLLFCKDQPNGYWLWDGKNTFTAGTVDPIVDVTDAGIKYTSAPAVTFQTTGSGHGVQALATVLNGSVTKVKITNPGSGFATNDFVIGTFSGGGSDVQATANAGVFPDSGGVTEIIVQDPGSGYTPYARVVFSGTSVEIAVGYPVIQGGAIISIAILHPGAYTLPPSIEIVDPGFGSGSSHVSGGSGWVGEAVLSYGQILGLNLTAGGSGYLTPPTITVIGDGTGFVATAEIASGQVEGFIIKNFGSGYTKALIILQGGNNAANAAFNIFPWGISGTAIETDQSRVWIVNGGAAADFPPKGRVIYSDPETPTGFGHGGGAFQSDDSFLRVGYHWAKQTNGFLYLGGDSSTNYISGISTTAPASGAPLTTFSNQNVDPQVGSPWPASVQVFTRNIVLANAQGIFVSYGGAMTKISTPIDPLFASCPNLSGTANWSAAVANIFNVQVYMLLINVFDPFVGNFVNKLIMWDGKRLFTSQQGKSLTFVAAQEVNSVLTAWGTDGKTIFPLFQQPSTKFKKIMQSKLYAGEGYFITKTFLRLQGVLQAYVADEPLSIAIDNETATASPIVTVPVSAGGIWYGAGGAIGSWTGAGGAPGNWGGNGLNVFGPIPTAQNGRLLGYTVTTSASDMALLSLLGTAQNYSTNV